MANFNVSFSQKFQRVFAKPLRAVKLILWRRSSNSVYIVGEFKPLGCSGDELHVVQTNTDYACVGLELEAPFKGDR